jgi:ribonuclease P protein component
LYQKIPSASVFRDGEALCRTGGNGFPRCVRLTKKKEFSRVFECSERSADRYFTVLARNNERDYPRLGLAISKKSVKLAVARQRIKRLIRESFRCHQKILPGVDIVVISRPYVDRQTNAVLFDALQRHWLRLTKRWLKV